jgi:hypothetical protein
LLHQINLGFFPHGRHEEYCRLASDIDKVVRLFFSVLVWVILPMVNGYIHARSFGIAA